MSKFIFLILLFSGLCTTAKTNKDIHLRIGWQVPWAIQGQIVQIFKHTEILKKNGLKAEFIGRTAGPELNELALANEVDVILTADQPASTLFMKSDSWIAISRLMYNRTSTYIPLKSDIKTLADLKKKKLGVPFGTAAQRIIEQALDAEKITNVDITNIGMLEHAPLIKSSPADAKTWGAFDALSGFDPIPAVLEYEKKIKVLHKSKVCSLVLVNKKFVEKNPSAAKKIILSLRQAYEFYKKSIPQADLWFTEESGIKNMNSEVFKIAAEYEPNFKSPEIRTSLNEEDMAMIQHAADFVSRTSGKKIDIKKFVTNEYQ